jgi:hypothetical protein
MVVFDSSCYPGKRHHLRRPALSRCFLFDVEVIQLRLEVICLKAVGQVDGSLLIYYHVSVAPHCPPRVFQDAIILLRTISISIRFLTDAYHSPMSRSPLRFTLALQDYNSIQIARLTRMYR